MLENRHGRVVGVEVKASSTVRGDDFRGLRHLAARLGDDFVAGVVLYTGTQTSPSAPAYAPCPSAPYGGSDGQVLRIGGQGGPALFLGYSAGISP